MQRRGGPCVVAWSSMADPPTLVHNGVYRLPPSLVSAFRDELTARGLLEQARRGTERNDVHGGEGFTEALDHFAYRFQTSATRPEHLLLATSDEFVAVRSDILSTLSSHRVGVLDLACGTGAGTLALLTVLLELRRANLVPTLPLSVDAVGADFSETARAVFASMCSRLETELEKAAICLTWRTSTWDGRHSDTTSAVCDEWLGPPANEYLVIINNFSGQGRVILQDLAFSWKHVGDRLHSAAPSKVSTWTWLESDANIGTEFLAKIESFFNASMKRTFTEHRRTSAEKYKWFDSITGRDVTSGAIVHQYRR
jgi:hypothetical protein